MEENHMRNLLVAQSGGPTAAINATVAGVVSCANWIQQKKSHF